MSWKTAEPTNVIAQDYTTSVALGNQPGVSAFIAVGLNPIVPITTVDIWNHTGVYTWQQTAQRVQAVSTSASDAFTGTGCQVVFIDGLDANFDPIEDIIIMDGLTPAFSTLEFIRVNFCVSVQAGVYGDTNTGSNIGIVTLTHETTGDVIDNIRAQAGVTDAVRYTVPSGKRGLLKDNVVNVSSSKPATITFHSRIFAEDVTGPSYGSRVEGFTITDVAGISQLINQNPFELPEKTDVWLSSKVTSGGGGAFVNTSFTIELHPLG